MRKILNITKALADENRIRALMMLRNGEMCVCNIIDMLNLAPSTVSKHMSILKQAELVETRRAGKWTYYRLADPDSSPAATEIIRWLVANLEKDPAILKDKVRLTAIASGKIDPCYKSVEFIKRSRTILMIRKLNVLFLCTGNSCRSQMAEGWCRYLKGDVINAYSAGIETHGLNPYAVKVMAEAGVDISSHRSKLLNELTGIEFDYVVTVCGHANEICPLFPGKTKVVHIGFDDPPQMAKELTDEEEKLNCYRRVRDEIKEFVVSLPDALGKTEISG